MLSDDHGNAESWGREHEIFGDINSHNKFYFVRIYGETQSVRVF